MCLPLVRPMPLSIFVDEVMHVLSGPADVLYVGVDPRVKAIVPSSDGYFVGSQKAKDAKGKGCAVHQTVMSFEGDCL